MLDSLELLFRVQPSAATQLEDVKFFLNRPFTIDAPIDWILSVVGLITVIVIAMIVSAVRSRKNKFIPQDWVVRPAEIFTIFQLALDQRAKFELQFSFDAGAKRPALRCSGVKIEEKLLVMEITGLKSLSDRWRGRPVDCFFQVQVQGQLLYYAFKSSIDSIFTTTDYCYLRLQVPERLETRQKRSYLRIFPPEEFMLGAALWQGEDIPEQETQESLLDWKKPTLTFLPTLREQFFVLDVSAGGVRLHVPSVHLGTEPTRYHVSDQLILFLDLWDPEKAQRLRFWVLCRVQISVWDLEKKGIDLGLQFLSWARPREHSPDGSDIEWLRLSGSGEIEPLGNWIMRRHLELFRETEKELNFSRGDMN